MNQSQTQVPMPYPSPLRNWDMFSWIRSKPLRTSGFEGLPFPTSLVPLVSHPRIACSDTWVSQVLAYRLLAHLSFTTVLELEHVNPVCSQLGRGESPVPLTEQQRNDALRIYCDEGGHALFVELLAKAVETEFGVDRRFLGIPRFHTKMRALLSSETGVSQNTLRHFFVSVSETLVTQILKNIPRDTSVALPVRLVIGDHAADEACHGVYFRWYFPLLWKALGETEREKMIPLLPDLIWTFLEPDQELDARILRALGFGETESKTIAWDGYQSAAIAATVRAAAKSTVEMCRKAGVLESDCGLSYFSAKGLL